jgi:aspartate 1-decarboxylase
MMRITVLKSKIHRAVVTDADLDYEGSITLDSELCRAARIHPYERVEIYNCATGARFATYVILGGPGEVCLNGAAARLVQRGDPVIIASYADIEERAAEGYQPIVLLVDRDNRIKEAHGTAAA